MTTKKVESDDDDVHSLSTATAMSWTARGFCTAAEKGGRGEEEISNAVVTMATGGGGDGAHAQRRARCWGHTQRSSSLLYDAQSNPHHILVFLIAIFTFARSFRFGRLQIFIPLAFFFSEEK